MFYWEKVGSYLKEINVIFGLINLKKNIQK